MPAATTSRARSRQLHLHSAPAGGGQFAGQCGDLGPLHGAEPPGSTRRGRSMRPSIPAAANRARHLRAVSMLTPTRLAMTAVPWPAAAASTMIPDSVPIGGLVPVGAAFEAVPLGSGRHRRAGARDGHRATTDSRSTAGAAPSREGSFQPDTPIRRHRRMPIPPGSTKTSLRQRLPRACAGPPAEPGRPGHPPPGRVRLRRRAPHQRQRRPSSAAALRRLRHLLGNRTAPRQHRKYEDQIGSPVPRKRHSTSPAKHSSSLPTPDPLRTFGADH